MQINQMLWLMLTRLYMLKKNLKKDNYVKNKIICTF